MANTSIEWTDRTWNPLAGCTPISPACKNCYAATMARRLEAMGQVKYFGTAERRGGVDVFTGQINFDADALIAPYKWKGPLRVFVDSMSDLFHPKVPRQFIARVWATMYDCPWITFQVLTKRGNRMCAVLRSGTFQRQVATAAWESLRARAPHKSEAITITSILSDLRSSWPLPNVHLGVTIENQQYALARLPALGMTPAAVRFVSCEPLLGPVRLLGHDGKCTRCGGDGCDPEIWRTGLGRHPMQMDPDPCLGCSWLGFLDWVIAGGESGHGARASHPDWIRILRDDCQLNEVPFLFKQWGEWLPISEIPSTDYLYVSKRKAKPHEDQVAIDELYGRRCKVRTGMLGFDGRLDHCHTIDGHNAHQVFRVGKSAAGRQLDGREWNEFPRVGV